MIQHLIIMTGSGVVIFEKVWVESETKLAEKGRLFGSLITTMQEFSRQSTGMIVSYLELNDVGISIVEDHRTKLICTLFHEREDGADFGKILAQQILRSFIETFGNDLSFGGSVNVGLFRGFVSKIFDAIQNSVRAILQQLQSYRTIQIALLVYDDGIAVTPSQEEDQLSLVANVQPLVTLSNNIMMPKKDHPELISMEMNRQIVYIHRVGEASLVAVCKKSAKASLYKPLLLRAVSMLEKVFSLSNKLKYA